jgi:hypothetical protein
VPGKHSGTVWTAEAAAAGDSGFYRLEAIPLAAETVRASEPDCPPPWTATSVLNRDEVSRKVSNAFRALMMSKEPAK